MRSFSRTSLVLLATLALVAPTATATWYSFGSYEPDNGLDDEQFMRFDPPGEATNLIYFNVIAGTSPGLKTFSYSPNVALLESNIEPAQSESHVALLGVWVDCNGDGYVGMAEGALREYPAQLLDDPSLCPATPGLPSKWTSGAHNYNDWVSEFVPIAGIPGGGNRSSDLRIYHDPQAMVWGDYGLPDDGADAGGSCALSPQPRGTYQSTAGLINFIDCSSGFMGQYNSIWSGRLVANQSVPGLHDFGAPDLGTYFTDDDDATGHAFWDRPTFGSEDSSNAAVSIVDCDGEPVHSGDTLNDTPLGPSVPAQAQNITFARVSPTPADPTSATVPGQVNLTQEEVLEDCDTANDNGHDFYGGLCNFSPNQCVGEGDHNSVAVANKKEAEFNFQFWIHERGPIVLGFGPAFPLAPGGPAGFSMPGKPLSVWTSGETAAKVPATVRARLADASAELAAAPIQTFYAYVGSATTSKGFLTTEGEGDYGFGQCGLNQSGIHNGWNCNPAAWYRNSDGSAVAEPYPFARPGQDYQFRDIDCYDGYVGAVGLGAAPPFYGENPCVR